MYKAISTNGLLVSRAKLETILYTNYTDYNYDTLPVFIKNLYDFITDLPSNISKYSKEELISIFGFTEEFIQS